MTTITKTRRAERDLDDIWLYIAMDNPAAADKLLDDMGDTMRRLAQQPLMGRARIELAEGLRSFSVGRYVLFYRPEPRGIELVRVLHGARDLPTLAAQGGFAV